jgi:hypothetical protein
MFMAQRPESSAPMDPTRNREDGGVWRAMVKQVMGREGTNAGCSSMYFFCILGRWDWLGLGFILFGGGGGRSHECWLNVYTHTLGMDLCILF